MNSKSVNSDSKTNVVSSGTELKKASNTTAAQVSQTSISGQTAAENTTTTTNLETSPEWKPIRDLGNAYDVRDIFSSRGHTGWE